MYNANPPTVGLEFFVFIDANKGAIIPRRGNTLRQVNYNRNVRKIKIY
jgi:hypothetical protein